MTQAAALQILKTGANVFLTGEPGAGKTHMVNEYVRWLRSHGIEPSITASTGIAATHVGGMTIHSWSGIGVRRFLDKYELDKIASNERVVKRLRKAKVLIIDEVSMLSPKTLDMVNAVCREILNRSLPFGGLQVVLVGDFFQLPPIMKKDAEEFDGVDELFEEENKIKKSERFAYHSAAWAKANLLTCYLTEQHRQDDADYLGILSAIRKNTFGQKHLRHVEKRKITPEKAPQNAPRLFSHNADVDRLNEKTLDALSGEVKKFSMTTYGRPPLVAALIKSCISPETLRLKIGASVMFTKNNPQEGYVNGTLGLVAGWGVSGNPIVKTRVGLQIEVESSEWSVEENGVVRARVTQLPLRLAWAITVHKSQGMSLDEAVMDLKNVFEFGQGYVALSRVRRLSGLHLLGWNQKTFQVHPEVLARDADFRRKSAEAETAFENMPASEISKMHERFIKASGGSLALVALPAKGGSALGGKKLPTIEITFALIKNGKTIAEIAKERKLVESTIANHFDELFEKKRITREEIESSISEKLKKSLPEIHAAFKSVGTEKLSPAFQKLKGKFSYDDLRLARMLYED